MSLKCSKIALFMLSILTGCSNDAKKAGESIQNSAVNFRPVVNNIATYYTKQFADFEIETKKLSGAIINHCAKEATISPDSQTTLKQQWRRTMALWQQIESVQIGPLIDNAYTLRNNIYSWPLVSPCGIDKEMLKSWSEGEDYNLTSAVKRKGLASLEYLIFSPLETSSCTPFVTEYQLWENMSDKERSQAKCQYMQIVKDDLLLVAEEISRTWQSEYLPHWNSETLPMEKASSFANQMTDAMYYLDMTVKDKKVKYPLGIGSLCLADCAIHAEPEHIYAEFSLEAIRQNLLGFLNVLNGGSTKDAIEPDSFLALLSDLDEESLSRSWLAHIKSAIEFINEGDVKRDIKKSEKKRDCLLLTDDYGCKLHGKIKSVTDQLKNEFIKAVGLNPPRRGAGELD